MKKILGILLFTFLLISAKDVFAVRPIQDLRNEIQPTIQAIKEEAKPTIAAIREQTRESIRLNITASPSARPWEIKKEIREQNKGLLQEIRNQVREKLQVLRFNARLTGKINKIGENYVEVFDNSDGKVYQVNITEKTQLRRRFWGKSSLSEFSVDDKVNVIGRFVDESKTTIEAVLIRNHSIQRRWGVFFGEILSKEGSNLRIKTVNRGELNVYIVTTTKLFNRKGESITLNDIQLGHRVRIKGIWNKELKEIKETEEVKDFSSPVER